MKIAAQVPAILFICVLGCIGQQENLLSDEKALAAAGKAFTSGNWNPDIFEVMPITRRRVTLDEMLPGSSEPELKKELLEKFGSGPCTVVAYRRRPAALKTNGGESYCTVRFLVFSTLKVAIIDSRAYPCPADMLPKKGP